MTKWQFIQFHFCLLSTATAWLPNSLTPKSSVQLLLQYPKRILLPPHVSVVGCLLSLLLFRVEPTNELFPGPDWLICSDTIRLCLLTHDKPQSALTAQLSNFMSSMGTSFQTLAFLPLCYHTIPRFLFLGKSCETTLTISRPSATLFLIRKTDAYTVWNEHHFFGIIASASARFSYIIIILIHWVFCFSRACCVWTHGMGWRVPLLTMTLPFFTEIETHEPALEVQSRGCVWGAHDNTITAHTEYKPEER